MLVDLINSSVIKDEKARFHLNTAAELLMCDSEKLEKALITRVIVTPEGVITRTLDPASAIVSRYGLAKTIYSRLFDWKVDERFLPSGDRVRLGEGPPKRRSRRRRDPVQIGGWSLAVTSSQATIACELKRNHLGEGPPKRRSCASSRGIASVNDPSQSGHHV
uniref:Myosin motor domain-containing protein n=1 Tax=Ananas comosus var. bracteatus TaxID=296719 RepID=A0A6V7P1V2_ANACO|nr:unnamed protein product [Ananas comosus var. bracteatus]